MVASHFLANTPYHQILTQQANIDHRYDCHERFNFALKFNEDIQTYLMIIDFKLPDHIVSSMPKEPLIHNYQGTF